MTEESLDKKANEIFWLSVLLGIPYFIWLYSIATELNKRLPKEKRIPSLVYQVPFFFALSYIPIAIVVILSMSVSFEFILRFHFTAMASVFFLIVIASISVIKFE